ncbi:HU family DNA-binding protein [Nocardioides sp.]|uniref:HU family DNA-binding protein n=1 Tax=Nocardioides sp. TaxID=35761 RepID=UPI0039E62CD9
MNKTQLIDALAARFDGNRKAAAHALESVIDTITREVAKGEKVAITGFGSFEKRLRPARTVRNPQTGEAIKAKKKSVPKFTAGAELKAVVSGVKKLPKLTLPARKAAPVKVATTKTAATKTAATKTAATKAATSKATATKAAAKKTATTAASKAAPAAKKTATAKKAAPAKTTTAKTAAKKA